MVESGTTQSLRSSRHIRVVNCISLIGLTLNPISNQTRRTSNFHMCKRIIRCYIRVLNGISKTQWVYIWPPNNRSQVWGFQNRILEWKITGFNYSCNSTFQCIGWESQSVGAGVASMYRVGVSGLHHPSNNTWQRNKFSYKCYI